MLDGMGSSGHVVGRLPVRILETSLSLRGMKEGNDEPLTVAPLGEGDSWSNCCPMAATFSVKKEAKLSAVRLVAGGGGGGEGRVLKVENNFRASVAPLILSLKKVFLAAVMLDEKEASSVWQLASSCRAAALCDCI